MRRGSLLDSFALLAFLNHESGSESVRDLLRSARAKKEPLLMNEVNLGEVYYRTAKQRSVERAEAVLDYIATLPLRTLGNTYDQVLAAARLKAGFPISYADAFAVATAQRERATLVTGDAELHAVEHLVPIRWI